MSDMLSALVHATVLLVFVLGWPPPVFYKLPECTSHRTGRCPSCRGGCHSNNGPGSPTLPDC